MVIVLSFIPAIVVMGTKGSLKLNAPYISSAIITKSFSIAISDSASIEALLRQVPVGLFGVLTIIAFVRLLISVFKRSIFI